MVVVLTQTGKAARLVSKYRPACPIVAITQVRIAACFHYMRSCCYLLVVLISAITMCVCCLPSLPVP